jgi:transposase-like protein
MRRREAREAVRMAMFLNLLNRWESAELNQAEAAELLGVSERTFRRWRRRYEEGGEAGLLDGRLGKASGRRVPADRAEEVERLYRERYQGFTVKHFHEHLVKDHGLAGATLGRSCIVNGQALWRRRRARGRTGVSASGGPCRA